MSERKISERSEKMIRYNANREARRHGYEVRPTVVRDTIQARRLAEGFAIMGRK